MADIRGLWRIKPALGWGLMLGALAIVGMPPFGVFAAEFLLLTTTLRELPWAAPLLLLGLAVAFAAIFARVQAMVFGEPSPGVVVRAPAILPVFVHMALALMLGLYVPQYLTAWFRAAARIVGP
jgi:formate hydrogenlyase subunit 3/multisubunit Na+/H+ antiporter MnhD subunit